MKFRISLLVIALSTAAFAQPARADTSTQPNPSIATFGHGTIDLRHGWGAAKACASDGQHTTCFTTEAAMDDYLASVVDDVVDVVGGALEGLLACSPSVKLYPNTSFGGTVLSLSTQGVVVNLSTYGVDNTTSSYKVGGCNSIFYDGANGAAPVYPGSTAAGATASSMSSGWDNRISSIFISL